MFDIGWTELMVIGVVALIVIGPKDLPEMFRTLGRFTAKAKGMAREFSRAMETAADEAGVKDVASDLRKMTSAKAMGLDAVKDAASKFEAWDPLKSSKSTAAKPDPAAPTPDVETPVAAEVEAPKSSTTKAMLEAQAAKRAERSARTAAKAAATPVVAAAPKAAPKAKAATTKAAGKSTAKPAVKTTAKKTAAPKTAAKKPSPKKSDV